MSCSHPQGQNGGATPLDALKQLDAPVATADQVAAETGLCCCEVRGALASSPAVSSMAAYGRILWWVDE